MPRYTPVVDHLVEGLQRVPEQYRDKPLLGAYFSIYLRQVELLHDGAELVPDAFALDRASGFRLDWLGGLVGQPRRGSTDDIYQHWIGARILANRSRGKNPDVRKVAAVLLADLKYYAESNAISVETSDVLDAETAHAIAEILQYASAGIPVYLYYTTLEPLTWCAATGLPTADGTLDDADETVEHPGYCSAVVLSTDPC